MKKIKSIQASLIAAVFVLLVSISVPSGASSPAWKDPVHWAPYSNAWNYFWGCTIFQACAGSKWR
ncbi:MAG: hypothetical protein ACNYPE_16805 [Candidatus Azotimanducaceae bacterium WSBS_2022_MAG_OTU7]